MRTPDYRRAADAANRVLIRLGIDRLPVRPLNILRRVKHTKVYTYDQAAKALQLSKEALLRLCGEADAFTLHETGEDITRYVVCYRQGGNPARLNFTLAHELGHIILRHTENSPADEAEADCFAGSLLCPSGVIQQLPKPTEEKVARMCYVSLSAAKQALERKDFCRNDNVERQMSGYVSAYIGNGERHLLQNDER